LGRKRAVVASPEERGDGGEKRKSEFEIRPSVKLRKEPYVIQKKEKKVWDSEKNAGRSCRRGKVHPIGKGETTHSVPFRGKILSG